MNRTIINFIFFFFLIGISACVTTKRSTKISLTNKKVLFLGNSITHNGLYVSLIEYALYKSNPGQKIDIISVGLGSETVSCLTEQDHPFPRPCLKERLDRAINAVQPDLIVSCYGINDGIYHPLEKSRKVAFQNGIEALIQKAESVNVELILITPTPFDPIPISDKVVSDNASEFSYRMPYKDYDRVLEDYSEWLLTKSPKIKVIDWHSAINAKLQQQRKAQPNFTFAKDGVHPNEAGHLLMAIHFLSSIGADKSAAFLKNWTTINEDSVFQKIHQKRQERSERWRNYIGYTRGKTVKSLSSKNLLVLMGGQSNMVGLGKKEDLPTTELPEKIQYLDYGRNANLRKNNQRFGPEIGLSKKLTEQFPDQHFTFLKYAIGGASLLDWSPDYSNEKAKITGNERFGNMFAAFFQKIDSLFQEGEYEPVALLWMQGERDARIPEAGKDYYQNFKNFITAVRHKIGNPNLPILVGEVNPPAERYLSLETVRTAQVQIAKELSNVFLIETDDLSKLEDDLHYDSEGQLLLGERFGEKLVEHLKGYSFN